MWQQRPPVVVRRNQSDRPAATLVFGVPVLRDEQPVGVRQRLLGLDRELLWTALKAAAARSGPQPANIAIGSRANRWLGVSEQAVSSGLGDPHTEILEIRKSSVSDIWISNVKFCPLPGTLKLKVLT